MVKKRGFCYDKDKYSKDSLVEKILVKKKRLKLSNEKLGELLGISGQAFSKRLADANFDFIHLVKLFDVLEFSQEEVLKLMVRKE